MNKSKITIANVLGKARSFVSTESGWMQHGFEFGNSVCLVGAIAKAYNKNKKSNDDHDTIFVNMLVNNKNLREAFIYCLKNRKRWPHDHKKIGYNSDFYTVLELAETISEEVQEYNDDDSTTQNKAIKFLDAVESRYNKLLNKKVRTKANFINNKAEIKESDQYIYCFNNVEID